jgi:macrolide phosphotransferase
MTADSAKLVADTLALAARNGLRLTGAVTFSETGLDFRVGFATDIAGQRWVLRIPRRDNVQPKIEREARILDFVKHRLPIEVPDWQVRSPDLVAYPMLTDPMALVFDSETYAVTWNIDQDAETYVTSLAEVLVALHRSPVTEAIGAGIPASSPQEARDKVRKDLECVTQEIGIDQTLEARYRRWLDDDRYWPEFSVLTHGDLYAGHVTATAAARVSGVIDWTEAEISDPAIDFAGHLAAFGLDSLKRLVAAYELAGGQTWPAMVEHIIERHAASPIKYGVFAISTGSEQHLAAARSQLMAESGNNR